MLLLAAVAATLVPMAVWSLECLMALFPARKRAIPPDTPRPRIAVVVPAHDEVSVIGATLAALRPQVLAGDLILVVADNCSDATADVARGSGAMVAERRDSTHAGKGYALEYALHSLEHEAPEVLVVIDADCVAHPEAIDRIARLAHATGRPVQANYLMEMPTKDQPAQSIAALAFRIKNFVRPLGLERLGLPCFLNGSGMAFPAAVLKHALLGSGKLTEDKWLTVDLILAGHAALFCCDALVTSRLPSRREAQVSQQTRWLHGHLECMGVQGARLLGGAIRQRRWELLALFCDLLVPPISLLMMLWLTVLGITVMAWRLGYGLAPAMLAVGGGLTMAFSFIGVVLRFGEKGIARELWAAPFYIASKIPIYVAFAFRRQTSWVRTGRDTLPPPD